MVGLSHLSSDPNLLKMANQAGPGITNAIYDASQKTGADFAYLMEKASAESSFRPQVQAQTSSATGLFQFIESTWLRMVDRYGEKHGLGDYAEMIDENGGVDNPHNKKAILDLRKDPKIASLMAAEFASENKRILEMKVEGDIGPTELYFAHFMGASGASKFLNAYHDNPQAKGADLFPKAAKANQNVFYNQDGSKKSLNDIFAFFDQKFTPQDTIYAKSDVKQSNSKSYPVFDKVNDFDSDVKVLSSRSYSSYQKAFIPFQDDYDSAISELLLSPYAQDSHLFYEMFSANYLDLIQK